VDVQYALDLRRAARQRMHASVAVQDLEDLRAGKGEQRVRAAHDDLFA
jgi:hypothetical protein